MLYFNRLILVACGIFFLLFTTAYSQTGRHIPCDVSDSISHKSFHTAALKRIRYGTIKDRIHIDVDTLQGVPSYGLAAPVQVGSIESPPSDPPTAASSHEEFHLLGSRCKTIGKQSGLVNVLLIGNFLGSNGSRRWALIEMFSSIGKDSSVLYWSTIRRYPKRKHTPETNSLRIFDHKPTNADIYQFLDEWAPYDGGFFTSEDDPLIFLGGEICEETWTTVVGEPPTRFFPEEEGE